MVSGRYLIVGTGTLIRGKVLAADLGLHGTMLRAQSLYPISHTRIEYGISSRRLWTVTRDRMIGCTGSQLSSGKKIGSATKQGPKYRPHLVVLGLLYFNDTRETDPQLRMLWPEAATDRSAPAKPRHVVNHPTQLPGRSRTRQGS